MRSKEFYRRGAYTLHGIGIGDNVKKKIKYVITVRTSETEAIALI